MIPHSLHALGYAMIVFARTPSSCDKNTPPTQDPISLQWHNIRMVPKTNYGCIISGGIDSTLQAAIMNQYKVSDQNLVINHGKKDQIMKHINKFNFYFKKNILKIKFNKEKYIKLANKCYNIISSPLQTHDLPARLEISNFFKRNQVTSKSANMVNIKHAMTFCFSV